MAHEPLPSEKPTGITCVKNLRRYLLHANLVLTTFNKWSSVNQDIGKGESLNCVYQFKGFFKVLEYAAEKDNFWEKGSQTRVNAVVEFELIILKVFPTKIHELFLLDNIPRDLNEVSQELSVLEIGCPE